MEQDIILAARMALLLAILLCLSFFSAPPALRTQALTNIKRQRGLPSLSSSYVTTRHQAIIDFVAALQMHGGGFVESLFQDEEAEGTANVGFAVESLALLGGLEAIDVEAAINFVLSCQREDGCFVTNPRDTNIPGYPGDITEIYFAVRALHYLSAVDRIEYREEMVEWVLSCQRSDGGFNQHPDIFSDFIWDIARAVMILNWTGCLDRIDRNRLADYLISQYYQDCGGFSLFPGQGNRAGRVETWEGVVALEILGALDRINADKTAQFMMQEYNASSGSCDNHITFTETPISVLEILDRLDLVNTSATVDFVLSCQSHLHGAFVFSPNHVDNPSKESAATCANALSILAALGALDQLDADFAVEEEPVWHGDPYEPEEPTITGEPVNWGRLVEIGVFLGFCLAVVAAVYAWSLFQQRRRKRRIVKKRRYYRRRLAFHHFPSLH